MCFKTCQNSASCNRDELCGGDHCYPKMFFRGDACAVRVPDGGTFFDGGPRLADVPVANPCLVANDFSQAGDPVYEPGAPSGNCGYTVLRLKDRELYYTNCIPAGTAALYATCTRDRSPATAALQCGVGLECSLTAAETGVCLKVCNAADPRLGMTPTPACDPDEACVNLYRQESVNSVLGVCMKTCNVFSADAGTCAPYGAQASSCVPASADGRQAVTSDGSGLCVPQRASVAAAGQPCANTDPLKGASCASGLSCVPSESGVPICTEPCDLACAGDNPPSRCASEPHATCPGGKTCTAASSTNGAILGFCR
jgi:hypothetical protein